MQRNVKECRATLSSANHDNFRTSGRPLREVLKSILANFYDRKLRIPLPPVELPTIKHDLDRDRRMEVEACEIELLAMRKSRSRAGCCGRRLDRPQWQEPLQNPFGRLGERWAATPRRLVRKHH